ncbi:heterokaryon incompatibility protein-domain-containing protein, partial [Alternaria alternata]
LVPKESTWRSYVALSHCWGDAQPLRTTSETLLSFQTEIPAHELPPTFSDAIYVARALGFTHIWIDSLCIIQDNESDWEYQSSIMASIYSNADLVLAVAAAKSANEGFLRKERPSHEGTVSLDIRGSATSFFYRVVPKYHEAIDEPLYKRGWTLQERLCARRFLAYGNWEMSWECKESSCCEHHGNNIDGFSSRQRKDMFGARMEDTSPQDFAHLWRNDVVESYSQRSLTKPTDTPVAISALASRFQSRFHGTYLAGLWQEDICTDLL